MITVEAENYSLGIKHRDSRGVVANVHFLHCRFSEHLTGMTFEGCIFEDCIIPPAFDKNNSLSDCIC